MEYQVPQFIEVEDKIFGPLTLKQFIYLAGGGGLAVGIILYIPLPFGAMLALPIGAFAAALAFYKINGKPFLDIIEAGFNYYIGHRLYLWRKEEKKAEAVAPAGDPNAVTLGVGPERAKLGLSGNRLHELALTLDVSNQQQ